MKKVLILISKDFELGSLCNYGKVRCWNQSGYHYLLDFDEPDVCEIIFDGDNIKKYYIQIIGDIVFLCFSKL